MMYDAAHMAAPFFNLKGKTLVLIDWANVFHAQRKNGWTVDTRRLFALFKRKTVTAVGSVAAAWPGT